MYLEQREVEGVTEGDRDDDNDDDNVVSPMTTKVLLLVSYLLSQPGIKSAILQLIGSAADDEKYKVLLPSLVQTLNTVSNKPQHIQAQEAIVVRLFLFSLHGTVLFSVILVLNESGLKLSGRCNIGWNTK